MSDPITAIAGGVATAIAAVLAYIGTQRGRKANDSIEVMDQVREWATQLQDSEAKCRSELAVVRTEVGLLRGELHELWRTVERNNG